MLVEHFIARWRAYLWKFDSGWTQPILIALIIKVYLSFRVILLVVVKLMQWRVGSNWNMMFDKCGVTLIILFQHFKSIFVFYF